ncbi:mycothiol synthase [Nocardioides sp. Root190]|uniref:mycothiol synthase n=1 Tax=Nocardioides sp. Root190 TaxID=1736488 RepID=UPI0006F8E0D8|nr:mycothiol synthase [Nocardioides sp. Root190]KRB77707.1 mycothiol synthase [Nocardioides sp. Root190]
MSTAEFLTGGDALERIEDVARAAREHDGADPLDEAVRLRLRHHGLDDTDAWVTADGFALRRGTDLDVVVAPAARGRGLGGRLAALAGAEAGELAAWSHGDLPAARAIAARLDFSRARELWVMRRPTVQPLPATEVPNGVLLRDFGEGDADALLEVNAAAFAHHPEQGGLDAVGLAERRAEPWFDPAGLLMAVDSDGALLGFHWTKQHDAHTGEVYVLGISPAAQGRGLGKVLTIAGLHHLASRGVAEVLLYVEADNTAARRLYAGLGFGHAPQDTHVQYRRAEVLEQSPKPATPE